MRNKEASLEESMKNADLAAGLDLDMLMEQYEDEDEDIELEAEHEKKSEKAIETDEEKGEHCCPPCPRSMKINCNLEVEVGNKNKIINVCPGRLQFFTASAISCCGDETIEIEFCGHNTKCVFGETFICGRLGFYKIVKSGIIFIPSKHLSKFTDECFPTDILHFKAKSRCDKDVEFVVVFAFSRCVDCCCSKQCRNK